MNTLLAEDAPDGCLHIRRELERYRALEEEERRIARHLIDRLIDLDKLRDPSLRHWLLSAAAFSGDLLAAARTPGGMLHVLLADGTGHGLSASINALPVAPPFYRMTEKGFGIDAIARELNVKTKQFLPVDRFVAATLAAVDFREGIVQVWNGGNPKPFFLDAAGNAERVFGRTHMALGILDDDEFDDAVETHAFGTGAQLILYSDGLLKAESLEDGMFGHDRLAATLAGASAEHRLDAVISAVTGHLGGQPARDDISVVLVDCVRGRQVAAERASAPATATATTTTSASGSWRLLLRLGTREVRTLDVVPMLLGLTGQFEGLGANAGQLFVVLSELYNNALDHGLLRLDSRLKLDPSGMEAWLDEREQRMAAINGEIEFDLEQFQEGARSWLRITCRDSGPGFDPAAVLSPGGQTEGGELPESLPFGRGVALLRSLCASLQYNEAGNAAIALMALGVEPHSAVK
ncbi:MAG: SpoIIE family protein phosphatase [Rhodocyclaceae bacterium]|nr:SpoIIE family protein phosphatase [Rhodocyclaceae bacterium]